MFGTICFMIGRNIAVGVTDTDLIVRPGPKILKSGDVPPYTRPMDFTGRPMKGFVYVESNGLETDTALAPWVERARRSPALCQLNRIHGHNVVVRSPDAILARLGC
ncbi:MAG: hypothetical protein CM1200mP27_06000 [Chloroflexota bacterium]|nr:MAG: hypothetical protein CM1200mP27_06000 [Chloroflexota bacterium]